MSELAARPCRDSNLLSLRCNFDGGPTVNELWGDLQNITLLETEWHRSHKTFCRLSSFSPIVKTTSNGMFLAQSYLHGKHCGVKTLAGFEKLFFAPQPWAHAALGVPLLVVDVHHHVVVVSVVEVLLLLAQKLWGLSLGQGPSTHSQSCNKKVIIV